MKIRDEIFEHPDWWNTNFPIDELNETEEEFNLRVAYLNHIEPNSYAMSSGDFYAQYQLDYETLDEYRARMIEYYRFIDMGVDEKFQDGYYRDERNIKKDMLQGKLDFNKEWYENYLKKKHSN